MCIWHPTKEIISELFIIIKLVYHANCEMLPFCLDKAIHAVWYDITVYHILWWF